VNDGVFSWWNGQSALKVDPARLSGKYDPITSTMSLAAAICSIFCDGIVPMRVYFSLVCSPER
jgi:hypothetical protein